LRSLFGDMHAYGENGVRFYTREKSSVPWLGFPVGYAVSGVLLTVFGYFAMMLAH